MRQQSCPEEQIRRGNAWPDVIPIPIQGAHYAYHWNGSAVDYIKRLDDGVVWEVA